MCSYEQFYSAILKAFKDQFTSVLIINVLGPVGDKVEEWTLKGAWIKEAAFGDLDWATNDAAVIACTLKFDYAILQY